MSNVSDTKWLRVLAIMPSSAMAFMDQSILPVALPTIGREFGVGGAALQWSVNAYLLGTAVFVLMGGKLGDRIGYRKSFLWGMILFAFFSVLCGLSQNIGFLILARALQGMGAGIIFPAQIGLIAASFPPKSRGQATGIVISIGSLFAVIGPFVGGFLTEYFSWRWAFWINLPIAIAGVILTLVLLSNTPKQSGKVDLWGFLYFSIFATFITIFFMQAQGWGWLSGKILLSGLIALASLYFLLAREKTARNPFLALSLFKLPIFAAINVSISMTQFILMITVLRTIYTEEILGYTPTQTGLIISASCIPLLFFSYLGGLLSDKISPKLPIVLGYIAIVVSFFSLGFNPTPSLPSYFVALLLFGMGIPFIFTPSYSVAMSAVPRAQLGVAAGLISTLRNLSGTIGLAMIYLFVDADTQYNLPTKGKRLAEIGSFSSVNFLLGFLMIIAFFTAYYFHKRKSSHQLPDSPADGWD